MYTRVELLGGARIKKKKKKQKHRQGETKSTSEGDRAVRRGKVEKAADAVSSKANTCRDLRGRGPGNAHDLREEAV